MHVNIACQCGRLRGVVNDAESLRGRYFVCMCDDCQTYARHLGRADVALDRNGGTGVVPVFPARLKLLAGFEQLRCLRLSENGLYRWYADCCKSPLANSLSGKMGYIGLVAATIDGAERDRVLGPVKLRMMAKFGIPPLPPDAHPGVPVSLMLMTMKEVARMLFKGLKRPSPFFDPNTGEPVVEPYVLALAERDAARPAAGVR